MIAYIDTSVLLRVILEQKESLEEWSAITLGVSSVLLRVEAQRALDRLYLQHEITSDEFARRQNDVREVVARLLLLPLDDATIDFAARPLSPMLRSLDSLHLATAVRYRRTHPEETSITFATHDRALAAAARAHSFPTIGV